MSDVDEEIARLKEAARERWGERWTVQVLYFSDGDAHAHAFRSHGRTDEGLLQQDRLFISDSGEVVVERVRLEQREVGSEMVESPE